MLDETGPGLGIPTLRSYCPDISRCVLEYLVKGYRRQFQAEHRLVVEALHWARPGTVWAIDHSKPPCPLGDGGGMILAIRDLASGLQLAWHPVAGATAAEALVVLEALVAEHGPPLVLKSDNGSAFISEAFAQRLAEWQVVPLLSPVRMPRYNGACEAGIGGMKWRTEQIAARYARSGHWTADDLYAALLWANEEHYPLGLAAGTAAPRFAARQPIDRQERDSFCAAVVQYESQYQDRVCSPDQPLNDMIVACCHRRAVRQALVELGYLSITRRSIPQPITTAKCARNT